MKKLLSMIAALAIIFIAFAPACAPKQEELPAGETLTFSAVGVNGAPVQMEDYNEKRVVMVNFWETWCNPCMSEMPALQKLYEEFESRGFTLIGVYSSSEETDVTAAVNKLGITYPVIPLSPEFEPYQSEYVPTTVFFDGSGRLLLEEPIIGARSLPQWEQIVTELLNAN